MFKTIATLLVVLSVSFSLAYASSFPLKEMRDSSVIIYRQPGPSAGHGSGVVVGPATVITAAHVAGEEKTLLIEFDNGEVREGTVMYVDHSLDMAVVSVPVPDAYAASPMACRTPVWGEEVAAVGNPVSIKRAISFGHVASTDVRDDGAYTLDIAVTNGSSGGPVFTTNGEVLGLVITIAVGRFGQTGFVGFTPAVSWCEKVPV